MVNLIIYSILVGITPDGRTYFNGGARLPNFSPQGLQSYRMPDGMGSET